MLYYIILCYCICVLTLLAFALEPPQCLQRPKHVRRVKDTAGVALWVY